MTECDEIQKVDGEGNPGVTEELPNANSPGNEKDRLEKAIERYLFTPRSRSKQQAGEFLKDWMQRYSRG